jgi:hypothetical protein
MAENNGAYFDYPDYTPKATFFRSSPRNTKQVIVKSGQVIKALSFVESDVQGKSIAHSGIAESALVTIDTDLAGGETLIIGGLTYTANAVGSTTKEVAVDWGSILDGTDFGDINTISGSFTAGTLTGYNTNSTGTAIYFNAPTAETDVADLTVTGTGASKTTLTITQGSAGFVPIQGVLVYDVDASGGDAKASVFTEASFWADALVWAADPNVDTIKLPDGTTKAVTAYNTGASAGDTIEGALLQQKFVEGSEFDPLGYTRAGEVY